MTERLREWEVITSETDRPMVLLAYNKAHAVLTAVELFRINPLMVTILERPEWN